MHATSCGLSSDAKQRHIFILEVLKNFIPGAQVDESSCNQIICSIIWKAKVGWVICKNLITMSRASM
jgi:hypothetical protein